MAVDKTYLLDLAPEHADVDEDRITRLVALAELQIPAAKWVAKADLAVALYVLHLLALGSMGGKGAVTSERIGDLERKFSAGSSAGSSNIEATVWGSQLKALGRTIMRGPFLA